MRFYTVCLILASFLQAQGADKYTDENRPYEFGFTIDGEQHRHEKKDENGIIMGEFGFITADGVYHVTVYATDENGNFKILSMKNIRKKPYPTSPTSPRKGNSLPFPPSQNPPQTRGLTAVPPPRPAVPQAGPVVQQTRPAVPKSEASPVKSCGSCSIPTTSTRAPLALTNYANLASSGGSNQPGSNPRVSTPGNYQHNNNNNPNYAQPNHPKDQQSFNNGQGGSSHYPQPVPNQNSPQAGSDSNYPQGGSGSNYPEIGSGTNYPQGQTGSNYNQQGAGPNYALQGNEPNYSTPPQSLVPPNYGQREAGDLTGQNPQRNPKRIDDYPQNEKADYGSHRSAPQKPTLISAQMQIVDKNTDIHHKNPGEKDGLPRGLNKNDMVQLLYTFNYTVGFHAHFEEGYTNGVKQGYYYVTGRNGVRTRIDYVADENGFRPKITEEVLDLLSDDVPKPETEKDEKYGLKGYEFKWLYYPVESKLQ